MSQEHALVQLNIYSPVSSKRFVFTRYDEENGIIHIGGDPLTFDIGINFKKLIPHLEEHGYVLTPYIRMRSLHRHIPNDAISGHLSTDKGTCPHHGPCGPDVMVDGDECNVMIDIPNLFLVVNLFKLLPYLSEQGGYHIHKK